MPKNHIITSIATLLVVMLTITTTAIAAPSSELISGLHKRASLTIGEQSPTLNKLLVATKECGDMAKSSSPLAVQLRNKCLCDDETAVFEAVSRELSSRGFADGLRRGFQPICVQANGGVDGKIDRDELVASTEKFRGVLEDLAKTLLEEGII